MGKHSQLSEKLRKFSPLNILPYTVALFYLLDHIVYLEDYIPRIWLCGLSLTAALQRELAMYAV